MQNKLRIGIVGSKFAANFHHHAYHSLAGLGIKVIGCYSPTKNHRDRFAAKRNIKSFTTFEDMLREVDVVDICAPGYVHEFYTLKAAKARKNIIVEKPFTGYYGPSRAPKKWRGDKFSKKIMLDKAIESARRIAKAIRKNKVTLCYAENWIYAPSIQKEAEILKKTKGQILWMIGEESHSGSHSPFYGIWQKSGGGSLVGKGCHPLTAILYLKYVEGKARDGDPIRPKTVSARMHKITSNPHYKDLGYLRTGYYDVEDFCQVHITFEDGFIADMFSTEVVMGGVHNWLEIYANNHRMRCNINPVDAGVLYNPKGKQLKDVYIVEKIGTKEGWSFPSPDEDWMTGYPQEMEDFVKSILQNKEPQSNLELAVSTVATLYAAYFSDEQKGREIKVPRVI